MLLENKEEKLVMFCKSLPRSQPELTTERLLLRPVRREDAPALAEIANDSDISAKLSSMPYPYTLEDAKEFIEKTHKGYAQSKVAEFCIVKKSSQKLTGMIAMGFNAKNNHATVGYWLGKAYWGRGYMTEALHEIVRFGFEQLQLHRIAGHHFHNNPASGNVMQKVGMKLEGRRVEHFKKGDLYLDILDYGLLRRDWEVVK